MKRKTEFKSISLFIAGTVFATLIIGSVVYAANIISSKSINYNNTTSKLTSTTVQSAIDELNKKVNANKTKLENSMKANFGGRVFVRNYNNEKSVCINRNNKIFCIKPNDYQNSVNKIQQEFNCKEAHCGDGSLYCVADTYGNVRCGDNDAHTNYLIWNDGSITKNWGIS